MSKAVARISKSKVGVPRKKKYSGIFIVEMECWKTRRTHPCKIILLDHEEIIEEMTESTKGVEIMNAVFKHLNILETAHFGLRYIDPSNQTHWLDCKKRVFRQLKGKTRFTLYFGVKFYAVDPCKLTEEVTRYQFFLQLKQDILQGRLPVSFELAGELGSYLVQSELGDYDPRRHTPGYVSEFRFVSNQTVELENKIAELHKELIGQQPALAELNYLEKVKWLEMYGVDLHPVLGEDNTEYFLGLTPTGVIVLRNKNKVASYFWPRITKIFNKGKYFMIRISDKKNEENTFGFETPSKGACRHLYKCSIEHHNFFRQTQSMANPCLQKDMNDYGRNRNNQPFVRVPSRRFQRRIIDDLPVKKEEEIEKDPPSPTETNVFAPVEQWKRSDSPRSTQSLPPARGLYSSNLRISSSRRSISVESRSSNDSKSCKSVRHNSKRRGSDNESEISKCSGKSRRRRNRSTSGSTRDREHRRHRSSSQKYVLVDSKEQWKEVQRKQAEGCLVQKAKVITSTRSHSERGYTDKDHEYNHHTRSRRHRKHRSKSPSEKVHMPEEIKKHLQFSLVDTAGMTESQLREIPYKVIETSTAKAIRIKLSPTTRKAHSNSHHRTKRPPPGDIEGWAECYNYFKTTTMNYEEFQEKFRWNHSIYHYHKEPPIIDQFASLQENDQTTNNSLILNTETNGIVISLGDTNSQTVFYNYTPNYQNCIHNTNMDLIKPDNLDKITEVCKNQQNISPETSDKDIKPVSKGTSRITQEMSTEL